MLPVLCNIIGGGEVYLRLTKDNNLLLSLDFMFGDTLKINLFRKYIEYFNQSLMEILMDNTLLLPLKKNHNKQGYFRYWVFKENMTALYYPNDSLPRYDCKTEEYYRADDCGINLLLDKDNLIAIDGWMSIPDELKHISDMKLVVA
jgi:hypothetical protein